MQMRLRIMRSAWVRACRSCRKFDEHKSEPSVYSVANPKLLRLGRVRRQIETIKEISEMNRAGGDEP